MKHPVVAPSVGESVTEVSILKWAKQSGEAVKVGDLLLEIESDKATVEIVAEFSGQLTALKPAGERITIGTVIGEIDDAVAGTVSAPAAKAPAPTAAPVAASAAAAPAGTSNPHLSPAVQKHVTENNLNPANITGTGKDGRLTKGDVLEAIAGKSSGTTSSMPAPAYSAPAAAPTPSAPAVTLHPGDRRVPMSMLRSKIAERLVHAQHTAAILTTFNEVDMTAVQKVRNQYKDAFKAKYGTSLGFMSFFTRACVEALKQIPEVNASIDGRDTIYHDYQDIGVAVGTERGLVVPVIRGTGSMNITQIEQAIAALALKARNNKLSIADLSGGTFTISNGGVYGSLLSTPILNPPQSGILGMHKIQDRPVAIDGKVEIRPMMYLALSYDHRLIDGKGAVTFLVAVKQMLEDPKLLGLECLHELK